LTIGVTCFPRDGVDPNELLRNADLALYSAKRDRRGTCRFFRKEMDREAQERWQLEIDLRGAIEKSQFQLYYQPIVDLSTKRICGCEALIRWEHSEKGWISPVKFIPIAEETGAIVEIGRWVLFKACADAVSWPNEASVSVNLSPIQFRRFDIVETVKQALETSGLDPKRLDLEITESTLLEDSATVREALMTLRELGVSISLDDFGTGYSSFSYLVAYPIDKVKLDRSFISAITTSREKRAVVRAASMLAEELGLVLVAEGVETAEELAIVAAQAIHRVQGFYFSRPVPIDQIPWEHSLAPLTEQLRRIA
jgi:EAL domain-containing protein (putative c-di-GMP-specific phosphodiesterase class I)